MALFARFVHQASKALIPPPTCQGFLGRLEVVHGDEVLGQLKHGPPQSHGPIPSPDLFGDGVKRAEGGNPDALQVEEQGRAEGL